MFQALIDTHRHLSRQRQTIAKDRSTDDGGKARFEQRGATYNRKHPVLLWVTPWPEDAVEFAALHRFTPEGPLFFEVLICENIFRLSV